VSRIRDGLISNMEYGPNKFRLVGIAPLILPFATVKDAESRRPLLRPIDVTVNRITNKALIMALV